MSWIKADGVSMISASSQRTQAVDGPMVVNSKEFRALAIAPLRAGWFSFLCLSPSSCDEIGGSKSCRKMVMLANLFSCGPDCVTAIAFCKACVAEFPSRVFGMMKPSAIS